MVSESYPPFIYHPLSRRPPAWVEPMLEAVAAVRDAIDSTVKPLESDHVLQKLRPGLEALGYEVESGKKQSEKISRPVLFGENGKPGLTYEVDALLEPQGVVVEIEAGRAAANNAVYRDIIRACLMVDARYLAVGVPLEYWSRDRVKLYSRVYETEKRNLAAISASGRLVLPLEGVLLFGY